MYGEIDDKRQIHAQTYPRGCVRIAPLREFPVHVGEFQDRSHYAHQGAACDEARRDERTLAHACLVERLVFRSGRYEPGDQTADQQRKIEL